MAAFAIRPSASAIVPTESPTVKSIKTLKTARVSGTHAKPKGGPAADGVRKGAAAGAGANSGGDGDGVVGETEAVTLPNEAVKHDSEIGESEGQKLKGGSNMNDTVDDEKLPETTAGESREGNETSSASSIAVTAAAICALSGSGDELNEGGQDSGKTRSGVCGEKGQSLLLPMGSGDCGDPDSELVGRGSAAIRATEDETATVETATVVGQGSRVDEDVDSFVAFLCLKVKK